MQARPILVQDLVAVRQSHAPRPFALAPLVSSFGVRGSLSQGPTVVENVRQLGGVSTTPYQEHQERWSGVGCMRLASTGTLHRNTFALEQRG